MTFIDAWAQATSEDDVTSLNSANVYQFGKPIQSMDTPLKMGYNETIQEKESMGQFYPDLSAGNYPLNDINANFQLVNGLPFYWMLGKAAHTTADTKQTISIFDVTQGIKPVFKVVKKYATKPHEAYGVCWGSLQMHHKIGDMAVVLMRGMGCKHELTSSTISTPTYPSSQSAGYDLLKHIKWGSDGSEAVLSKLVAADFGFSQNNQGYIAANKYYDHINHLNPITSLVNLAIAETNDTLLESVFAQTASSFLYKMGCSKNSNKYIEIDSNGATARFITMSPITLLNDIIGYNVVLRLQNPTVIAQDYVNDDFYEIPT